MNETERDRILRMVAEGTLRPHEAAHLLAALADEPTVEEKSSDKKTKKKPDTNLVEVELERPDGSHYTVKVPPGLVPMIWEITKATVRESARTAAKETWEGFTSIVRNKTEEVKTSVRDRFVGEKKKPADAKPAISLAEQQQTAAHRQILTMVQEGKVTAADASRLIQQLDAHLVYQRSLEKETAKADP